jgi:hypothetical protein
MLGHVRAYLGWIGYTCGLYYKHITIVNYVSSVVNKFGASLTDNDRVYNRHTGHWAQCYKTFYGLILQ